MQVDGQNSRNRAGGLVAKRIAVLLGATAMAGLSFLPPSVVQAQQVTVPGGGKPAKAPGGADVFGDADADHGTNGPNLAPHFNNSPVIFGGIAYFGDARGGDGGDGGSSAGIECDPFPPFCLPVIDGGNGGNGGTGGTVTITTTANLTTTGPNSPGMFAGATGGNGGEGGVAVALLTTDGGFGGNGGNGGNASAVSAATIVTQGNLADGIQAIADGGNGGDGGFSGAIGAGDGGNGGNGGSGGTAYGENQGRVETSGDFAKGMLVRSAGGVGGNGAGGFGLDADGGNGGVPTIGGTATGVNSGTIITRGNFASGMVVQSVGGGGGDGGGAIGFFGGGGSGSDGNDGRTATATNTGDITTYGMGSIGMLVESIGGGGGDGGGAAGIVSIGGDGGGGGEAGIVNANIGGNITTGADGSGDGAHGVLAQSVGGGGGNGGFALSAGAVVSVSIGGGGGTGGSGNTVNVNQSAVAPVINTTGRSASGIIAQSVGGGGGNGGGAFSAAGMVGVAIGGSGNAAGNGGSVNYNVANATVTTNGTESTGVLIQSVGGGGGNGGFAVAGAALAAVAVGGGGAAGGTGGAVNATTGGAITTNQDRSTGMIVQSIGGGGGNGGFSIGASLLASVGVGGGGAAGADAGTVIYNTAGGAFQNVTTRGADSAGIIIQSVGGGGGNGGFTGNFAVLASVGIGGEGGVAGIGQTVNATYNGTVETHGPRSAGITVQSIGGGGGNGGGVLGASLGVAVGIGGSGSGGGNAGTVTYNSSVTNVTTHQDDSAGLYLQSIGGGGGNGGFSFNLGVAAAVSVGGSGSAGGAGQNVEATISDGTIRTEGNRSTGITAQSIGGGGGNGGGSVAGNLGFGVAVGGSGDGGGGAGTVNLTTGVDVTTLGVQSHAILAQSVGGGGGSGGFAVAVGGPSVAVGGSGDLGGASNTVTVTNTGVLRTENHMSHGILAQSVGGGGGDGGAAIAGGAFMAVAVGGTGGDGGGSGQVNVANAANITTLGNFSHGILAQSVGGGGGNGGSSAAISVGLFAAASVSVGGFAGDGGNGGVVDVTHRGDINVSGTGSKGIFAQSVGGGGGNGGSALAGAFSAGLFVNVNAGVSIGGEGGDGGDAGGLVTLRANGNIIGTTTAIGSGGILAQSIGGGGGNGGRSSSLSGGVSTNASINLGAAVGGFGGAGGAGGNVRVETGLISGGLVITQGNEAVGIMAQSIGGGGGNGGDSWSGAGGFGSNVSVNATVTVGGFAGDGSNSGTVYLENNMTVVTAGSQSSAIVAQSIGGGGGNGGSSSGQTGSLQGSGVTVNANVSVGGGGGSASNGNTVDVINRGALSTTGDFSSGIVAQSIGGGGGIGGSSNAKAFNVGSGSGTRVDVNIGVGGVGGDGGDAMRVTVDNSGAIFTTGYQSYGIMAMSVGGGGGLAGAASAGSEQVIGEGSATVAVGGAIGLIGGDGHDGGLVQVTNRATIVTQGEDAYGISASSIGGGGGIGGSATASAEAEYAIGAGIGGFGGGAGNGGMVTVNNLGGGNIDTFDARSIGIFAQSVGGSGGAGGAGDSTGNGGTVGVSLTLGGFGAGGGNGDTVGVDNAAIIHTRSDYAHGIMAQSIGGGGGIGGAAGATASGDTVAIGITLGGLGGDGGSSNTVTVNNFASGTVLTEGNSAYGVFAQSVGGGGGSAGAGSTKGGESNVGVNLALGGIGGAGNSGGTVLVNNYGRIETRGDLSHGVFAQSIGGGGGASGAAANASEAETSIGIQSGLGAGSGADGGYVEVNNSGIIETFGDGALGIFAQSVGGGGGFGGVVSDESSSDSAYTLNVGGIGAGGGNGGDVLVTVSGTIITHGERAHGVVAQSVGGSGGYGGDAKGKTGTQLAIGGTGGSGGNGGDVTVIRTGDIITTGVDSVAIIAQSVAGGGGVGGAGFGRFTTSDDGSGPNSIGFQTPGADAGEGGIVTITQTGTIDTFGDRGHGIVAQAVAGGGGMGGTSSMALGQSGAGSAGGAGNAEAAAATANDQINVRGAQSYALFGQSAAGQGNASSVTLAAMSNLFAQGADSVAAYGESTAAGTKGNIRIDLNGAYTIGGSATGVAAMLVGGAQNVISNGSLLYAMGHDYTYEYIGSAPIGPVPLNAILESLFDDFSVMSITGTGGNDVVNNNRTVGTLGRVIGNIDLGTGFNAFNNGLNSSMVALQSIDLGGGLYTNDGLYTNKGIGVVAAVDVTGGFTQTATGDYVTDVDLNSQTNDHIALLGANGNGSFTGEAPLNFLSIDRLFDEYALAKGATMQLSGTGLDPVFRSTVGFDFRTRVDFGTDLILYAEKPGFEDLINDPASAVTDTGAVQMAQYLDGLEGVISPNDPPSELARLINMLRFLPDLETYGETLMRLTPHYAVHTYELTSRTTDLALKSARDCFDSSSALTSGNCAWFTMSPESNYERDSGSSAAFKQDTIRQVSVGALGAIDPFWSLGGAFAYSDLRSETTFKDELLSDTRGESWQAYALAKYSNGPYFVDFSLGGGTGSFRGVRDTTVDQVEYTPGETLEGIYLPELLLPGIGNSVTYEQNVKQISLSTRLGYKFEAAESGLYLKPNVQFDGRWIDIKGDETGSVVAFRFDGPGNFYYSATPGVEIGANIAIGDKASIRIYGEAGVELSNFEWEARGQFKAAEALGAPPLSLTEEIDSPLYRVGGGLELNGLNGVGFGVRYNGAFGERVEQQTISGNLKVRF